MRKNLLIALSLLVAGCAVRPPSAGDSISIVNGGSPSAVADCKKISPIIGLYSGPWGMEVGLQQAMSDAKNKAALLGETDTLVITSIERMPVGGRVDGIAFNCREKNIQLIKNVTNTDSGDVFEKAKKCQEKSGVWIEERCVINIE